MSMKAQFVGRMEISMKKGILIVSFGTTYKETREKNIEGIVKAVREKYTDCEIYQAYSSSRVRKILRERDGITIPAMEEALRQMKKNGVEKAVILPTHIIDGFENHRLKEIAVRFQLDFASLSIAGAFLEKEEDYRIAAKALWDSLKETAGERIVILMGHGSSHEADASYGKMEQALREYSGKEIYIATVEGGSTIEEVIERMKRVKGGIHSKRVLITPFMLVAGEHAQKDMAGREDSFLSKVRAEGYEAECLLKGIGEYEKIREIYITHLQKAE